jgi:hypothetical protein
MSDTAIAEVPAGPVPPVPAAVAEFEAASPEAAHAEQVAERALPFDVDHLGPLHRAVLDALVDADEPLSVARIIAEMPPGTTRGSAESAIKREFDQGRIERVGPGLYVLAKPKPPEAKPPSPPPLPTFEDEATWLSALEAWATDPASWSAELGPPPDTLDNNIPPAVKLRFNDRVRKREERRRDREAAQARQSAADQELRTVLLRACNQNYSVNLPLDDLAPVREVLKVLPLDRAVMVIRQKVDKRCYPANPPLSSWRDQSFLRALAEEFCRAFAIPGLVREWGNAGRTPATKAPSSPPTGEMPDDIDELRRHHDNPHAPPGTPCRNQLDAHLARGLDDAPEGRSRNAAKNDAPYRLAFAHFDEAEPAGPRRLKGHPQGRQ